MKKLFILLAAGLLFASCGGESKTNTGDADTTAADGTEVAAPDSVADNDTLIAADKPVSPPAEKQEQPEQTEKPEKKEKPELAAGSAKGGELIKASDCLTCHKEDVKLVGPAYADVAKKYQPTAANIDMLADKVIAGGSGNWGQIPMSPHPNVSKNDAKEMVKYILAVK
ncbi:c-type cytochrome [Mucilaginibacter sp. UR6-1]|uniref:c-type cytochrome n=1 Tax=Mucilaginibacter sp. UR6-1 TaxID=1435643 RepID=UPI001E4698A3|nr:c-type cytochrome [Mucilaginibacter sp. UR6-1]MCC8410197.1 c-type cytochrome [Mucilaginibacter sp. UR6-1]